MKNEKHGMSYSAEYSCWRSIIKRCHNKNHDSFKYYGGRGVSVCDEWRSSFSAFFCHIGPRPSKRHSVDRIDGSKNYEPGNVRWATPSEQANNRSTRSAIFLFGREMTLTEWARELGISKGCLSRRIQMGWPEEEIKNTPPRSNGRGHWLGPVGS